jgi:hypothetical protein
LHWGATVDATDLARLQYGPGAKVERPTVWLAFLHWYLASGRQSETSRSSAIVDKPVIEKSPPFLNQVCGKLALYPVLDF